MVTITNSRGITLSANATLNGAPLRRLAPVTLPGMGDYAERIEGRQRRRERAGVRSAKRSFLSGM